jgi:MFS family permease
MARPILSSLHAAFSFGGFAGAGLGALAAAGAVAPLPHLLAAAALFGVPGLIAAWALDPSEQHLDPGAPRRALRRLPLPLALLGAAAFCSLLAEGAASNWSAKLISGPMHGSQAVGAAAYAIFSVAMGSGRLVADRLWARWGAVGLLRRACSVAAGGFAGALAIGTPAAALAGFALLGFGLSGTVPTLYRAAAQRTGVPTGTAIAAVSSLGYFGFLAGPPIIGGLAQLAGLRLAVGVITVAATLVVLLAPAAAPSPAIAAGQRSPTQIPVQSQP